MTLNFKVEATDQTQFSFKPTALMIDASRLDDSGQNVIVDYTCLDETPFDRNKFLARTISMKGIVLIPITLFPNLKNADGTFNEVVVNMALAPFYLKLKQE